MKYYTTGIRVLHYRWKNTGKYWPMEIVKLMPRKWWQIQRRLLIVDPIDQEYIIAKEKDLVLIDNK